MELIVIIIYGLALLFIFLYSLIQIQLVYHYLIKKKSRKPALTHSIYGNEAEFPMVTIQLPVYNEKYVIERLIRAVAAIRYPEDRLEIQILDDSDDETSGIIELLVNLYVSAGMDISVLRRPDRTGFKAGALANGLNKAKGEFIAIFDADFIPTTDFLNRTIAFFGDASTGMVQVRWEHINTNYSMLTQLQAFGLDAHFSVEQAGRNLGGHFINFNGTAGIWRRKCIEDAGGWQWDTLTEDLDLSYRAQMKGWKFTYLEDTGAPAELPAEMNALKIQQYRWTKGAAECSRKNLLPFLRLKEIGFLAKVNGVFHLLNSTLFICIGITSLLSIPILYIKHGFPEYRILYRLAGLFLIGLLFLAVFYFTSYTSKFRYRIFAIPAFALKFPLFLSVSMGLALHNGMAAAEGLFGIKSPFLRTPKFNIHSKSDKIDQNTYLDKRPNSSTYFELLLLPYFVFGLYLCFHFNDYGLFPFLLMLVFGYGYVSFLSLKHLLI